MDKKHCQPCDRLEIIKKPPCSNHCEQPTCNSYVPKPAIDLSNKFFIWLYGAPGLGKTSVSKHLANKYNLIEVQVGVLLKNEIATGNVRSNCLKNIMSRGELVPNDLVIELMKREIESKAGLNVGYIVDGFPREIRQGMLFEKSIAPLNLLLFLDGDRDEATERYVKTAPTTEKRWPTQKRHDNCVAGAYQMHLFYKHHKGIIEQYPHRIRRVSAVKKPLNVVIGDCDKIVDESLIQHRDQLAKIAVENARKTNCFIHRNY